MRSTEKNRMSTGSHRGFTLLEAVLALAILGPALVAAAGLHLHAQQLNLRVAERQRLVSLALARLEELRALPFDAAALQIRGGELEHETTEAWVDEEGAWILEEDLEPGQNARYLLRIRVRQFNIDGLRADGFSFTIGDRLPGGTSAHDVHLKEVRVRAESTPAGGALRRHDVVSLRWLRAI